MFQWQSTIFQNNRDLGGFTVLLINWYSFTFGSMILVNWEQETYVQIIMFHKKFSTLLLFILSLVNLTYWSLQTIRKCGCKNNRDEQLFLNKKKSIKMFANDVFRKTSFANISKISAG